MTATAGHSAAPVPGSPSSQRGATGLRPSSRESVGRLLARGGTDLEQALVRLTLGACAVAYVVWVVSREGLDDPRRALTLWICAAYMAVGVAVLGSIVAAPGVNRLRRVAAIVVDNAGPCAVLFLNGELAAPLFVLLLWVAFGNGFRYGVPYLVLSAGVGVVGFVAAVASNGLWSQQPYWTGGIVIGLVILPAYAAALLRRLNDAVRRAEAASEAKSQFLANISHEIRTPLHGILGLGDLLRDTGLSASQLRYTELIGRSAAWLLEIVNDVLDFSKAEAGFAETELAAFDVRRLAADVAALHGAPARLKGVEVVCEADASIPASLVGDALHLARVLNNLVNNAVKFTDCGTVTVRAAVREAAAAHVAVSFAVQDTGIGIAPEQLGRIFEPFVQADGSTTRRHKGTGLGLAISRTLVEQMGGALQVTSAVGAGTTFSFDLRLARATPDETRSVEAEEPASALRDATSSLPRLRVLAVEDNPLNRELLVQFLTRAGCDVEVASNGREAVDARWQSDCDLILMDCQMPEMDGYAATEAIRIAEAAAYPAARRIPIIALTAHAGPTDRKRCLDAGMDDYLSKPFGPDALRAILDRWRPRADAAQSVEASPPPAEGIAPTAEAGAPAADSGEPPSTTLRKSLHDVNNLIMVITGHAEMCLEDLPEDSDLRSSVAAIREASRRAATVVKAESQRLRDERSTSSTQGVAFGSPAGS
jgi:two-component system, sensor histidine kinase RpfC